MRYKVYDTISKKFVTDDHRWVIKPDGTLKYNEFGDEIGMPHCVVLFFPIDGNDNRYIDETGGLHEEGIGIAPNGDNCGECSNISCKICGIWERIKA